MFSDLSTEFFIYFVNATTSKGSNAMCFGFANKITILGLLAAAFCVAGAPSQDFSINSFGLEYNGVLRGQYITEKNVPSYQQVQTVNFLYAPVQYMLFFAGIGAAKMSIDSASGMQFVGNYGFSPSCGLSLFTPFFLNKIVRMSGGVSVLFLNSEDRNNFAYTGTVVSPYLGLIFSAGRGVDISAGYRGHLTSGQLLNTLTSDSYNYSNRNVVRAYGTLTLHSPSDGAYISVDGDLSTKVTNTWNGGPLEASMGISVGVILHAPLRKNDKSVENAYFPRCKEMREKQKKMVEELE
jgi:hypothetical protein